MPYRYDLFLSHNHADKSFVKRVGKAVEADTDGRPLRVFLDEWDIRPGEDIPAVLERALDDSRFIGLVLSPGAMGSDWVGLERSTAVVQDPGARKARLVPLLRRQVTVPSLLARLKYIDFRRDAEFDEALTELLDLLRDRPHRRGAGFNDDTMAFRDDAELLLRHRVIFDRPAFSTPCIIELQLDELREALDDMATALATGRLYSRAGRSVAEFPGSDGYRTPEFRQAMTRVRKGITDVKRRLTGFERLVGEDVLNAGYRRDFWFALVELRRNDEGRDSPLLERAVRHMDGIDDARNRILTEVNALLDRCGEQPFALINRSSEINAQSGFFT